MLSVQSKAQETRLQPAAYFAALRPMSLCAWTGVTRHNGSIDKSKEGIPPTD